MTTFLNNILSADKRIFFAIPAIVLYFYISIEPFFSINSLRYEEMTLSEAVQQAQKTDITLVKITDAVVDCETTRTQLRSSGRRTFTYEERYLIITNPERTVSIVGEYDFYDDNTPLRNGDDPPIPCNNGMRGIQSFPIQGALRELQEKSIARSVVADGRAENLNLLLMGNDGIEFFYVNLFISSSLLIFFVTVLYLKGRYGHLIKVKGRSHKRKTKIK